MNLETDMLPEGALLEIDLEVRLPKAATQEQITEWLHYSLEQSGGIAGDNPLLNETAEAWGRSLFWRDTGRNGRLEKFDVVKTEHGETYRIRYHRDRRDTP